MKYIVKILNVVAFALMMLGVYALYYYFTEVKAIKFENVELVQQISDLDAQMSDNDAYISILKDSISVKDAEIRWSKEHISELEIEIKNNNRRHEEKMQELKNYTLEQALDYILSYYNTDSTEAYVRATNNGFGVVIQPRLIHEWSYTIEKLESTQITLKTYQKQANEYSLLVDGLENKINLLEAKDSLLNSSLNASENKNTVLQDIIENRNKKIKQIKTQRNIVTGVAVLVIVISLI
jgi:hypothetical protein